MNHCDDLDYELVMQVIDYASLNIRMPQGSGFVKKGTNLNSLNFLDAQLDSVFIDMLESTLFPNIKVKGIDYEITRMPKQDESPNIGSICYAMSESGKLGSYVFVISKAVKNALSIRDFLSKTNLELLPDLDVLSEHGGSDELRIPIKEAINSNFELIDSYTTQAPSLSYKKVSNQSLGIGLDKSLKCDKELSKEHTVKLSRLGLKKPWLINDNDSLDDKLSSCLKHECSGKYIFSTMYGVVELREIDSNGGVIMDAETSKPLRRTLSPEQSLVTNAISLGQTASELISLMFAKAYNNNVLFNELLILPRNIYYEREGVSYKILVHKLKDNQFKKVAGIKHYDTHLETPLHFTVYKQR